MALIEMDFAMGGGEHYEETLLYENASPSSTPSSGNLALNDDYTKYDLIKVKFRNYVSGTADTAKYVKTVYMTSADIKENKNTEGYAIVGFSRKGANTVVCNFLGEGTSDSNVYFYVIDSYIHILSIYGLKKVGGSESNIGIVSVDVTSALGASTTYTVPKKGEIILEFSNGSNNAPTVTIDGVSVLPRSSYTYAGKYNWQYVEMVTAGQVVVATMGAGSGRDGSLTQVNFE